MGSFDRLRQLIERVQTYPVWQVFLEMLVIWVVVFFVVRLIQGTRAAGILKTLLFFIVTATLLIRILGQRDGLQRLSFIYDNFLGVAAFALIVIFQPELRRGLTRIGETPLFRRSPKPVTVVVDAVVEAAMFLSKAKFGGLIVLERSVPLKGIVEGGTVLNSEVTARLLQTIFFPGSALHDLAVIISGTTIRSAGVQLPLASAGDVTDENLGSRHRAAMGVTQESDAVAVVVSEETGTISLAERGTLTRGLNEAELRGLLILKLNKGLVRKIAAGETSDTPEPMNRSLRRDEIERAGDDRERSDPLEDSGVAVSPLEPADSGDGHKPA